MALLVGSALLLALGLAALASAPLVGAVGVLLPGSSTALAAVRLLNA